MPITTEQLEKIAFMNAPEEHNSTSNQSEKRLATVPINSGTQQAKLQNLGRALYSCRRCSFVLFSVADLKEHNYNKTEKVSQNCRVQEHEAEESACSFFFLEQVPWSQDLSCDEGKLACPKCRCRVGSYTWYGEKCSCTLFRPVLHISLQSFSRWQLGDSFFEDTQKKSRL